MPRTCTPRQWREILDAFDRRGLSQAEFCRRRGLALATFRNHRTRAAAPPVALEAPRLVDLLAEPAPPPAGELRLEFDLPLRPVVLHGHPAPLAELFRLLAPATSTPSA